MPGSSGGSWPTRRSTRCSGAGSRSTSTSTDVPRDRFLVAGDAWAQYRSGTADPAKFGLSLINEGGDWWIAGNLMRDAAALLNVELLPWDTWGAMPAPGEPIGEDLAALFDRLAALTQEPETHAELSQL